MQEDNIVFDLLLIESDRFKNLRKGELDLYHKDPETGEFFKVAKAYKDRVEEMQSKVYNKKRTKFFITFNDTFDVETKLKPIACRLVRFMARNMNFNQVKGYGIRDFSFELDSHSNYIMKAVNELNEKDVIRFKTIKNHRVYMVNPTYYYRGSLLNIYSIINRYKSFPKYNPE